MRLLVTVIAACGVVAIFTACEKEGSSSSSDPPGGTSSSSSSSSGGSSSGSSSGGPATTPPPGTAGDFCNRTLGVVVNALATCCTAEDKATMDYRFTHDLAERLLPVCTNSLDASIKKNRVLWRADRGEACYAAYQTTYAPNACANITQTFSDPAGTACREAFVGVGAAGAPCMGDHECVEGLTCVGYTGDTDGSCKSPPAIGEACGSAPNNDGGVKVTSTSTLEFGSHPTCAAGARCDSVQRKCVKAGSDGEACTDDELCAAPLRCFMDKCGAAGPSAENGPCLRKDDCQPAFYCDAAPNATTPGACQKKKGAGGSCNGASFVTECIGRCNAKPGEAGQCVSFCGSP